MMGVLIVDYHSTYLEGVKKSNIVVGDTVTIMRTAKSHENGWYNGWNPDMDKYVGKTLKVINDDEGRGFGVGTVFRFPYFILRKASLDFLNK